MFIYAELSPRMQGDEVENSMKPLGDAAPF